MRHANGNANIHSDGDGDGHNHRNTVTNTYVPTGRFARAVDAGCAGSH